MYNRSTNLGDAMSNQLECYTKRHGSSNYYNLEFSKHVDINEHPLLTIKIENLSSIIKNDQLKFVLQDDGDISISKLEGDKYVMLNQKELSKEAIKIIRSISKIAEKMNISSLKNENFKPFSIANISTYHSFGSLPTPTAPFSISNFFKRIHKAFVTKFIVNPVAKKIIEERIKNKSPAEMAKMYVDNQELFASIKEKIINKNPSCYKTFQPQELETLINHLILESCGKHLSKIRLSGPSEKEIYKLDIARIINSLQHHNLSKNEYKKLLTVAPLDIPIGELAKVPVTPENEKMLSQLWGHVVGNLFVKGNLGKLYPGNKDHQTQYALAYLEARFKMPPSLLKHISKITNEIDSNQSIKNIVHYTMINSDISLMKKRLPFSAEIDLYNNKIKMGIDWFVNSSIEPDGSKVIENLVYRGEVYTLAQNIYTYFTPEEKIIICFEDLMNLIFISTEKAAAQEYDITETQFNNFKQGREAELQEKPSYVYNESSLDALKDTCSASEIKIWKDFLFISKVLDTSLEDLKPEEKKRFNEILIDFANSKEIPKILIKHIANEGKNNTSLFLEYIPKFLLPLFKNTIEVNALKGKLKKIPYGISLESMSFINNYLNMMKSVEKSSEELIKSLDKSSFLLDKFKISPDSINKKEKLTFQELGIISKVSRYEKNIEDLIDLNLNYNENPKLKKNLELVQKSKSVIKQIEKIISPEVLHHYRSGDLLAYNSSKKEKWHNHPASMEEKLTAFVSNGLTHGGKLLKQDDKIIVSHLLGGVTQNKLDLYNMCISDIYEINITPLFTPRMQMVLKKYYGDQWNLHVNKIFVNAETKLHNKVEKKFKDVENDQKKRTYSALANFPRLAKFFTGDSEITGHKKAYESSREKVYDAFFGSGPEGNVQICSEWASKATLAAMMEANTIIAGDLARKTGFRGLELIKYFDDHQLILPTDVRQYLEGVRHWKKDRVKTKEAEKKLIKILKENNYSSDQIELIIRIGNKEIFNIPYDRRERLKNIHPGRMVKLLAEKNCLKKRELPPTFAQLIAAD